MLSLRWNSPLMHREWSAGLDRRWGSVDASLQSRCLAMKRSLLMLRPSYEGWKLMDNGKPVFWFPEKSAALEVANMIAEARHAYSQQPTGVEVESDGRALERVSTYG
ncbi:hypothetical protein CSC74_05670 [Pseudoxanthomonas yeongjuensis]|nr:hypothetical protein CSC74_05670 [Pseudoxanthomonas yeongjuensis]